MSDQAESDYEDDLGPVIEETDNLSQPLGESLDEWSSRTPRIRQWRRAREHL